MFLRWTSHDDPNTERDSTLKPVIDWVAARFGYKLGDEGYAWVAAGIKGLLITLPVGGMGVVLWPLAYELGSHFDHWVSELTSGFGAGLNAYLFWMLTI